MIFDMRKRKAVLEKAQLFFLCPGLD